ncbi:MAG: hypothetical protein GC191_17750 [Azospirillum sp.]|nr:hypothetical protein [Azospirillum sp.]
MSWIATLDELIRDSWSASRQESAQCLDGLLALPLARRWELLLSRDSRLGALSDGDYRTLLLSLNVHESIASELDRLDRSNQRPALPSFAAAEAARPQRRLQLRRVGLRWLSIAALTATSLMLVGAVVSIAVTAWLYDGAPAASNPSPGLPAGAVAAGSNDRIAALEQEIARLSAAMTAQNQERQYRQAIPAAMAAVAAAIEQDAPFGALLADLAPLAKADPQAAAVIERLRGHAQSGLASRRTLRDRFGLLLPRLDLVIADPDGRPPQLISLDSQPGLLTRLVTGVRRTFGAADVAAADQAMARLADARTAVAEQDLTRAVDLLQGLTFSPAEPILAWLTAARDRTDAEAAITALRQWRVAGLSAPGSP